jgi:hypothetical protein
MAYRDYIICPECDCKLLYDGNDNLRESLEDRWGDPKLSTYTVGILCPDCLDKLRARVAELEEAQHRAVDDGLERAASWCEMWACDSDTDLPQPGDKERRAIGLAFAAAIRAALEPKP